jgi:hypothetical protein
MLESVRRRVRGLIRLIEKTKRNIVYNDFEDELGEINEGGITWQPGLDPSSEAPGQRRRGAVRPPEAIGLCRCELGELDRFRPRPAGSVAAATLRWPGQETT